MNLPVARRSQWLGWIFLIGLVGFVLVKRMPTIIGQFRSQGQHLPTFSVPLIRGGDYDSAHDPRKRAFVFWATWCGPCEVELGRLQQMIDAHEIDPGGVIAISISEDEDVVRAASVKRGYTFLIGLDKSGAVAHRLKIPSTPTIILRTAENKAVWISSGISPTLVPRLRRFFL